VSEAVFMDNDLGSVLYVGKNELTLLFKSGVEHKISINTRDLLYRIESRMEDCIETKKCLIEPMYHDPQGALLTIITVKNTKEDEDKATVFLCDLREALKVIERPDLVY